MTAVLSAQYGRNSKKRISPAIDCELYALKADAKSAELMETRLKYLPIGGVLGFLFCY